MGDVRGFLKHAREATPYRPVDERVGEGDHLERAGPLAEQVRDDVQRADADRAGGAEQDEATRAVLVGHASIASDAVRVERETLRRLP